MSKASGRPSNRYSWLPSMKWRPKSSTDCLLTISLCRSMECGSDSCLSWSVTAKGTSVVSPAWAAAHAPTS